MNLLFGTSAFLPLVFLVVSAVAITTSDPLTRFVTAALAVGILVGLLWEPISRLVRGMRKHRD